MSSGGFGFGGEAPRAGARLRRPRMSVGPAAGAARRRLAAGGGGGWGGLARGCHGPESRGGGASDLREGCDVRLGAPAESQIDRMPRWTCELPVKATGGATAALPVSPISTPLQC